MKSKLLSLANLLLIITIIFSLGIVVWMVADMMKNKSANINETLVWRTYQNKILGYEIQYPSNWSIKEDLKDNNTEFISKENTIVTIGFIPQDILNEIGIPYCGAYPNDKNRCEWIDINGIKYAIEKNSGFEGINIIRPNGGALSIGLKSTTVEKRTIFEKMLSTFEFIK